LTCLKRIIADQILCTVAVACVDQSLEGVVKVDYV